MKVGRIFNAILKVMHYLNAGVLLISLVSWGALALTGQDVSTAMELVNKSIDVAITFMILILWAEHKW